MADLTKLLRAAGRQRNLAVRASQVRQALAAPQLAAPPVVAAAYGQVTAALVGSSPSSPSRSPPWKMT